MQCNRWKQEKAAVAPNIEALEKAIEILESLPDSLVNLNSWKTGDTDCGTVACVVGHCCLNEWFNAKGLTLTDWGPDYICPHNKIELCSWDAVEGFFGLSSTQSSFLFKKGSYDSPTDNSVSIRQQVINRIKEFVDRKQLSSSEQYGS